MTDFPQGTTQALTALFFTAPGVPVAVSPLTLTITSLTTGSTVLGPVAGPFINPQVGAYIYNWAVPIALPIGQYLVTWNGAVTGDPIVATEVVVVTTPGAGTYTPGPCEVWPVKWPASCDLSTASPEITGIALQAASELLYEMTAQRFGECQVALRPCREECYGSGWVGQGWASWSQWPGGGFGGGGGGPTPYWNNGNWYNMGCGQCGSGCSCTAISEVWLPGPIASIVEVKVDGVVLVNGLDYRVDDYRKVVRLGAMWPYCNDLNQPDTATGTWVITASYGEPVPTLGQLAVGEIACEFVKLLTGEECSLPNGITDLTRQGISMSFGNTSTDLTQFFARYPISYLFIKTYNPNGLQAKSAAYDLDGPGYRAVGTS